VTISSDEKGEKITQVEDRWNSNIPEGAIATVCFSNLVNPFGGWELWVGEAVRGDSGECCYKVPGPNIELLSLRRIGDSICWNETDRLSETWIPWLFQLSWAYQAVMRIGRSDGEWADNEVDEDHDMYNSKGKLNVAWISSFLSLYVSTPESIFKENTYAASRLSLVGKLFHN
jgi:hypothetical protein